MRQWALFGAGLAVLAAGCGGAETAEQQRVVEDQTLVIALPSQPENLNPIAADSVYEGNQKFFNGLLRYAKDLTPAAGPRGGAADPQRRRPEGHGQAAHRRPFPRRHAADRGGRRVHLQRGARPGLGVAAGLAAGLAEVGPRGRSPRPSSSRSTAPTRRSSTSSRSASSRRTRCEGQDLKTTAFNRRPIGTGPYVIKEFKPGGRIVMEANPDYFRGAPKIKRVVLTAVPDENARVALLEKGAIDAAGHRPQARRPRARERSVQRARGPRRRTRARSRCPRATRCCATRPCAARCRSRSTASGSSKARWPARASPPTGRS